LLWQATVPWWGAGAGAGLVDVGAGAVAPGHPTYRQTEVYC
jgi:hypothetical protein